MTSLANASVVDEVAICAHGALVVVNIIALDTVGNVRARSADCSGGSWSVNVVESISTISTSLSLVAGEVGHTDSSTQARAVGARGAS